MIIVHLVALVPIGYMSDFSSYEELSESDNSNVMTAAKTVCMVGKGAVMIRHIVEEHNSKIDCITCLYPVFYIPELTVQLLSMSVFL